MHEELDQRVSSKVLRSGHIVDMEGRANKICGHIRCPGNQRKRGVKQNPQVLDGTTESMELVFTEKKKGDRFREGSKSLVFNKLILRCFSEMSQTEALARAL